jgi:SpoVK/Ycf46/Vps4 family AAA+-type ATPase
VFDHVRERRCVLFFDEFDTLGKERGDIHETGEIKRVVSSLLLQIDQLPSYVVIVVATNHPELLDRAAWRRFQIRLSMPPPSRPQMTEWFHRLQEQSDLVLGLAPSTIATRLRAKSFSELEDFSMDVLRRLILEPETSPRDVVTERLAQWKERFEPAPSRLNG